MTNETITIDRQSLERIEELLTLIAKMLFSEKIEEIFSDKRRRVAYEGTGIIPQNELAKKTGLSAGTISNLWQKWEKMGLLVKDGKQYRRIL